MTLITDESFDAAYDGLHHRLRMLHADCTDLKRRVRTARLLDTWHPDTEPLIDAAADLLRETLEELERRHERV